MSEILIGVISIFENSRNRLNDMWKEINKLVEEHHISLGGFMFQNKTDKKNEYFYGRINSWSRLFGIASITN